MSTTKDISVIPLALRMRYAMLASFILPGLGQRMLDRGRDAFILNIIAVIFWSIGYLVISDAMQTSEPSWVQVCIGTTFALLPNCIAAFNAIWVDPRRLLVPVRNSGPCPVCSKTVSRLWQNCPHCDCAILAPHKTYKVMFFDDMGVTIMAILFIGSLSWGGAWCVGKFSGAMSYLAAPSVARAPTDLERQWAGEADVSARLKDPDSAQFRDVVVYGRAVCGYVNSKNSYGGYAGYQRFISAGQDATFLESEIKGSDFPKVWRQLCGR